MIPIRTTVGPLGAASANAIVTTVTPTSGLTLTLTSSPYTMDKPRRVLLTYGTEGTARTLTLTGTSRYGVSQSETLTAPVGSGGTVNSVLDYATVTSIVSNSNFTNPITVGTSAIGSSPWVRFDGFADPAISIQCVVTGTVNYSVEQTLDDPDSPTAPVAINAMTWTTVSASGVVGASITAAGTITFVPTFLRVSTNTGTGSVAATFQQSGVAPY